MEVTFLVHCAQLCFKGQYFFRWCKKKMSPRYVCVLHEMSIVWLVCRFTGTPALYIECDVRMCHGSCPVSL